MPTHKVKNGYQWGNHGKVYPTKAQADKQGQAIYASGWREKKKVNESFTPSKLILMGVLRKVSDELYDKGYDEEKIGNFINNRNIQLGMDGDGYTFLFNNDIMFHIEPFPQLNDVINNASKNMIQWFENKINNIQENKDMSKKQLIRLTENDLHKIIKESINNILTELDWRTYDSAGQKALKKFKEIDKSNKDSSSKMYQRALKLNKASDKAFEKQTYGQSSKEKRQSLNDYYGGKTKYNKDTKKWENK